MIHNSVQPMFFDTDKLPRQQSHLAKSNLMADILTGTHQQQANSHFIDSLQRFRKDFATYDKEQRQKKNQTRLKVLEEKKNLQIQRQSRLRKKQQQMDQQNMRKINNARYLCQMGLKKNGITNGLPLNPITLQYHRNLFGNQQKFNDQEEKLKRIVRTAHIQNASTSGYNPINGQQLSSLDPLIPKNIQGRLQRKLNQFYERKKFDPNVDLQLNPKNMLPRYIGEIEHNNRWPIKRHDWQMEEKQFQTAYRSQFSRKENCRKNNKICNIEKIKQPKRQEFQPYYGQLKKNRNDENINPYLQDSAYLRQLQEMKR